MCSFMQVDAFTTKRFSGNSAAVCIQEDSISDDVMQQIASEMNLTMTAFVRRFPSAAEGYTSLRSHIGLKMPDLLLRMPLSGPIVL